MMKLSNNERVIVAPLLCLFLFCCGSDTACTSSSADDFVAIESTQYDKNYSSITSVGKRPYGFEKDTWYYNNPTQNNPCVKITGVSLRRIEVMVEVVPQSRLCVRQHNTAVGCADSGTGRFYSCQPATADTTYFEFYCDKQCAEHDVQFWYRIVIGESPVEDPEDHWCDDRSHEEYPENLLQLPPNFDIPKQDTTTPFNGGHSPLQTIWTLLLMIVAPLIVF